MSAESSEEAYAQMLELVSDAMGCSVVAIEHLDHDRDKLVITSAKGIPAVEEGAVEISLHRTLSSLAIRSHQPVLQNDPGARKEFTDETLPALNLTSFAAFPLMVGGSANGTLMMGDPERIFMGDHFEQLGVSLATTLAAYVERLEAQEAIRESEMRHRTLATQLQQANQELESFAYSVSHDLRAPLRTMQGFAHALVQNFGSDLLAYSRLSFERLELMPVELNAVVDQAREQVQADLTESQAHVTVEEPLPTVRGNVTALVQVVANLLSNAVKFVPDDRKPEVRIWSEEREGNVRLWVEDNGVGVPVGQEERIFRVFERLTESGNRAGHRAPGPPARRWRMRSGTPSGWRKRVLDRNPGEEDVVVRRKEIDLVKRAATSSTTNGEIDARKPHDRPQRRAVRLRLQDSSARSAPHFLICADPLLISFTTFDRDKSPEVGTPAPTRRFNVAFGAPRRHHDAR